jgi:recombination protein RecR
MQVKSWERLVAALKRLPGIGPKQAERLALHLLRAPAEEAESLIAAVREAKSSIRTCRQCCDYTDQELCRICCDPGRDQSVICVVEEPQDASVIEQTRSFKGLYHILHGTISPLDGIGPEALRIRELIERVRGGGKVREVILATDPDTEGEATALYLAQLIRTQADVRVSRIAQGVPMGGNLDYMDERTLSQALSGRREV